MNPSTPSHRNTESGPIDRATLLDRAGGDDDLVREIASIFMEEYPRLLREIEESLAAGNAKRVELAAHSLKGSVANFGAQAATQAANRLETIGRSGVLADAPAALADLLLEFQRIQPFLEQLGR